MASRFKRFYRAILVLALLALGACTGLPASESADGNLLNNALAEFTDGATLSALDASDDCLVLGEPSTDIHQAILDEVNAYRLENGLNPLTYSRRLEAAAEAHCYDLYARSFFDHINPDGESPSDRAEAAGFCHPYVGENIAAGQPTVTRVMQAWKDSPPHNANLLEPDYVYIGIGHYTDPNGRQYWGQLFAFQYP